VRNVVKEERRLAAWEEGIDGPGSVVDILVRDDEGWWFEET
jgi:hypothetical protein